MPIVALCLLTLMSHAQVVAVVNYMKVPANGFDAFVSNEKEWKKIHQTRVNDGKMIAWELFYIHDTGTGSDYNCATVDVYPNLEASLTGFTLDDVKKILGPKYDEVVKKTNAVRNLVYSETLQQQLYIPSKTPDKYLMVSAMRASDAGRYYEMEKKAFMPVHQAAIDQGKLNGWSIWSRAFAKDNDYIAYAVNAYSSAAQIGTMDYVAAIDKAKEGKNTVELMDIFKLFDETESIRTIVKSELWELVDATMPKK